MLRWTSTGCTLVLNSIRRTDGRLDVPRVVDRQGEVLEAAEPRREPDGDSRLLVRADARAAAEREARRRGRRDGEEAARAPDDAARAERRQARDAGAAGGRRRARGSRAAGAAEEGGGPAAAAGARRAGEAARGPAAEADRVAAVARDAHRGVPVAEGSDQGAVLGGRGAGSDRRGRDRDRPRHAGHRPRDRARAGEDGADAGARVRDRRAHRGRRARGLHLRGHAARPGARTDLAVEPGRRRAREAEGRGRRRRAAEGDRGRRRRSSRGRLGSGRREACRLDRRVEDAEPACEIGLDRQFAVELRLELELLRVVALLVLAGRDERPERAALAAVDPVDRVLAAGEAEDGGEELLAESLGRQLRADCVDGRYLVLEVRVAHDDPLEAEGVALPVELRAAVGRDRVEQLLHVAFGADELAGRERLEDDRRRAPRLEVAIHLQRHRGGREREELLPRRRLQLLPPEQDIAESHGRTVAATATTPPGSDTCQTRVRYKRARKCNETCIHALSVLLRRPATRVPRPPTVSDTSPTRVGHSSERCQTPEVC